MPLCKASNDKPLPSFLVIPGVQDDQVFLLYPGNEAHQFHHVQTTFIPKSDQNINEAVKSYEHLQAYHQALVALPSLSHLVIPAAQKHPIMINTNVLLALRPEAATLWLYEQQGRGCHHLSPTYPINSWMDYL